MMKRFMVRKCIVLVQTWTQKLSTGGHLLLGYTKCFSYTLFVSNQYRNLDLKSVRKTSIVNVVGLSGFLVSLPPCRQVELLGVEIAGL